eukprot:TRINITY_DN67757_c0_g1_i5.p3 TRINITY_DN67757_c0_g1~~TRINITY_DN67757_c0_g1_i5.p3  ORF type:complete len:103 (-),score=19.70 TRINITY_DN67757_c0_g1_i5:19-327(-)
MHPYGNYVMQHLIEYGSVEQQAALTKALVERIEEVGRDEYACAVLSKAMLHGEEEDRQTLAASIESVPGLFAATKLKVLISASLVLLVAFLLRIRRKRGGTR